ncbi:recombinase family protein [Herbiconiux sp. VKM Ac-2851]|uniref:recombinase family protein n=1 Tax=Herbiconiux sp. VKM Ac-2851 TaxID=2739025 RepID=UPI0015630D11|nr:recombinase family protein [Herbiconiux sp. VKM Ac-2851]NQX33587.1 recombinase family protein [Herbiconiux sp. VKM Ac-2851]
MTTTTGTRIGYLRISMGKQDETLQHDALDKAGVKKKDRYTDKGVSGSKTSRPALDSMLSDLEEGDTIVVYKLDRLGRSTAHVASLIADLTAKGIFIESISDGLNSSTPTGRAMLQMLSIFAEMERSFIIERTTAGLASAKAQGRVGGRPKVTDSKKAKQAQALRDSGESVPDIAKALGISIATVYRITRAPAKA